MEGENVSCSEVENALALIPCVKEVAVYPVEIRDTMGRHVWQQLYSSSWQG